MSQHRPQMHQPLYSAYSSPTTASTAAQDDLLTPMQQLSVQDPDPSYLFQPFVHYSTHHSQQYYNLYPYSPTVNPPLHPGTAWNSPPMSPAMDIDRRRESRGMYTNWTGPSVRPYVPQHYAHPPFRPQNHQPFQRPEPPKTMERRRYHPQAPANQSDWVMWVGNVPSNATHEELWKFFNSGADSSYRGPSSIFLISRSSCAFVNLTSEVDLQHAVGFFNGRSLRPWDARCPRLVCRIRRKDDDLRSGVGAQRGTGMHRQWVEQQQKQQLSQPQEPQDPCLPSAPVDKAEDSRHRSSASYASTNSSFLIRHFPMRVFILKSMTLAELEESVKTGVWTTQRHNEPVLDQAFRTSQDVYLVFGANRSGEFFGYAKMIEHIDKEKAKKYSAGSKGSAKFGKIQEEPERPRGGSEPLRPSFFLSPSESKIAATSPGEITPADEYKFTPDIRSHTDPARWKPLSDEHGRAQTLDPKKVQPNYFPPVPIPAHSAENEADRQQALGGSSRSPEKEDRVLRKDTVLTPGERNERQNELTALTETGTPFKIQWLKVGRVPFTQTRHLRNPWNADREVKVSRDGTEVEPSIGSQLMAQWDDLDFVQ